MAAVYERPSNADRAGVVALIGRVGESAAAKHLKLSVFDMIRIAVPLPVRADILAGARARLAEPVPTATPKPTQLGLFSAPAAAPAAVKAAA